MEQVLKELESLKIYDEEGQPQEFPTMVPMRSHELAEERIRKIIKSTFGEQTELLHTGLTFHRRGIDP